MVNPSLGEFSRGEGQRSTGSERTKGAPAGRSASEPRRVRTGEEAATRPFEKRVDCATTSPPREACRVMAIPKEQDAHTRHGGTPGRPQSGGIAGAVMLLAHGQLLPLTLTSAIRP
ncbi:hypothetical protein RJE46_24570 (plasmid) [Cedecea neteri]|uniref:hypothetical protein n=1 Tax=Cedecea neteri TaxID=158822 RepID=UPI00289336F5|nr:hypothetical protein [Cedecea neteri]WNJ82252.1 hypothetical protein RJE46_24570 [Cedecea neteri]